MKKINLIICVCSFIAAALCISCKNETAERKNVSTKNYTNSYTISGKATEITNTKTYDASGNLTTDDTQTAVMDITGGRAEIFWSTSETKSTNGEHIRINAQNLAGKLNVVIKDIDGNEFSHFTDKPISELPQYQSKYFNLIKIGKKYYAAKAVKGLSGGNEFVIVSEGFDCENLTSGKDFTLTFSYTEKTNRNTNSQNQVIAVDYDSKEEKIGTETNTYNIVFTAL